MLPVHFTVTQVRVAASCPRILYFDSEWTQRKKLTTPRVTRIWKDGDAETTAGGVLFHQAVEKFNHIARTSSDVDAIVRQGDSEVKIEEKLRIFINRNCVNLEKLASKPIPLRQAFIRALAIYVRELAGIIHYAKSLELSPTEIVRNLFGDIRKRVDVTFHVGPNREPVHVTGALDYVFFDWRTESHRILDYKLTPSHQPTNDLFQVSTYALMHHHQHQTKPDVAVLYLHPQRVMHEMRWEEVYAKRHEVYDLLASMAEWVRYNEKSGEGLKPIGNTEFCGTCRWNNANECERRLGAKDAGDRLHGWTETPLSAEEPTVDVTPIPESEETTKTAPDSREDNTQPEEAEPARTDGQLCIGEARADCQAESRCSQNSCGGRGSGGQRQDLDGEMHRGGSGSQRNPGTGDRSSGGLGSIFEPARPGIGGCPMAKFGARVLRKGRNPHLYARNIARDSIKPESDSTARQSGPGTLAIGGTA